MNIMSSQETENFRTRDGLQTDKRSLLQTSCSPTATIRNMTMSFFCSPQFRHIFITSSTCNSPVFTTTYTDVIPFHDHYTLQVFFTISNPKYKQRTSSYFDVLPRAKYDRDHLLHHDLFFFPYTDYL